MMQPLKRWELLVYYMLVFLILYEWLVPILQLTNTGRIQYFMLFILVAMFCTLMRFPSWLTVGIKVLYIGWFITLTHGGVHLLTKDGLAFLVSEVVFNVGRLVSLDIVNVTNSLRTFLFFMLIWMLMYLIHYWLTVRYSLFYFIVITIFFIATLDTFSPYDGTWAIVKVLMYGLILTGILFAKRLLSYIPQVMSAPKKMIFVLPMIVCVIGMGAVAYALPKNAPIWPDPVPFIKTVTNGGSGVSKVGYDEDDRQLGGAFEADDTLVFTAQSQGKRYWRIDERDTYTSKGWENSFDTGTIEYVPPKSNLRGSAQPIEDVDIVSITMSTEDPYILSPYGNFLYEYPWNYMVEERVESGYRYSSFIEPEAKAAIPNYRIHVVDEAYSLQQLRDTDMSKYENLDASFDRYLQLPENLPQRVRDLAVDITESVPTAYQKARAIENYFALNGYRYSTSEAAIPGEEDDYVDQFLFETKVGYCDNFSTSMVVLLRSLDIPARWVKGFVTGDAIDESTYAITNNEAHSWVEVYLVGTGWVPFEPTIGFNGDLDIEFDLDTEEQLLEEQALEEPSTPEAPTPQQPNDTETATQSVDIGKWLANMWQKVQWFVYIMLILIVIIVIMLYRRRQRWLPNYYIKQANKEALTWQTFDKQYQQLIKQLKYKGLVRQPDETLAAFAKRVDMSLETTEMATLIAAYEQYIYSDQLPEVDFHYLKECWEYLINRTSG